MCAIYGFLDYGKKINHRVLNKLVKEMSIAAEYRGTDATGISYVNDGQIVTYKKAKPAHKVKLYFPKGTTALIGHNRMTTQGNERYNFNNHPFEGETDKHSFALAHNGILRNDKTLRKNEKLPFTHIETDSYIAVQLLEQLNKVDAEDLKEVAEKVEGSFVFTVLRDDNTLYLVKGDNPITLLHFPDLGLYLYASTAEILKSAMKFARFREPFENIMVSTGDIVEIDREGNISMSDFKCAYVMSYYDRYICEIEEQENLLLSICGMYGVNPDDVELLLEFGYSCDEIEEMMADSRIMEVVLKELKAV